VPSNRFEMSLRKLVESEGLPPEVAGGIERVGGPRELSRRLAPSRLMVETARYHMALSDTRRLRILYALSLSEMCPCVLKRLAGTSDSKLSYHLKVLESERLISSRRVKKWRIYSITRKGLASIKP